MNQYTNGYRQRHHIHFNSTTAIESALLDVPSHMIAIPEGYKEYNLDEVNLVSYIYSDPKELLDTLVSKNFVPKMDEALQLFDGLEYSAQAMLDSLEFPDGGKIPKVPRFDYKKIAERKISELKHVLRKRTSPYLYRDRKIEGLDMQMILDRLKFYSSFFKLPQMHPRKLHRNCFLFEVNNSEESCIYISFLQRY